MMMMNEQQKKEIQKKLEDQERLRRLEEAGEYTRAPWESEVREQEARRGKSSSEGSTYMSSEEARMRRERGELTEEEMRRSGSDRTEYPAGTGSYYSETFVKPSGRASPESSFNEPFRDREPPAHAREMTEEEMRRSGSDRVDYPAGTGSYYSETFVKPSGRASPESYFNEPFMDREPPARRASRRAGEESHRRRTERHHPVKRTRARHAEPARPVAARRETVHRELMYERPREGMYREPLEKPVGRIDPFTVRSREPPMEERYEEVVRYEEEPLRKVTSREPERYEGRTAYRGGLMPESEWRDPSAGRVGHWRENLRGRGENVRERAQTTWGGASTGAQRYGSEAANRGRDVGARLGEWTRGAGERAREMASGREAEDSAYRAGSAIGSAIRKMSSITREMGSGFREGMGEEYPKGGLQEARERYREEESRYQEEARERGREGGRYVERERYIEEEEPTRQVRTEVKEKVPASRGEMKERTPSKRTSSSASSRAKSQAKRAASTTKRKVEKATEEDW